MIGLFTYYNPNPDGKNTSDCVIRALSKALNQTWDDTYTEVSYEGLVLHDMPDKNYVWSDVLKRHGFKKYVIPNTCPACYSVKQFCADNPVGTFVLCLDGHVVTCQNGNYFDTWDSGDGVPIYYWKKE